MALNFLNRKLRSLSSYLINTLLFEFYLPFIQRSQNCIDFWAHKTWIYACFQCCILHFKIADLSVEICHLTTRKDMDLFMSSSGYKIQHLLSQKIHSHRTSNKCIYSYRMRLSPDVNMYTNNPSPLHSGCWKTGWQCSCQSFCSWDYIQFLSKVDTNFIFVFLPALTFMEISWGKLLKNWGLLWSAVKDWAKGQCVAVWRRPLGEQLLSNFTQTTTFEERSCTSLQWGVDREFTPTATDALFDAKLTSLESMHLSLQWSLSIQQMNEKSRISMGHIKQLNTWKLILPNLILKAFP